MYYLSGGDETLGDFLRISLQADNTLIQWEALRNYLPKPAAPTRVRIGPDWTALVSILGSIKGRLDLKLTSYDSPTQVGNWLTEWERTGNTFYRDRIATGMTDIGNMPVSLLSIQDCSELTSSLLRFVRMASSRDTQRPWDSILPPGISPRRRTHPSPSRRHIT